MISFQNNVCSVVADGDAGIEDEQVFDFGNNVLTAVSINKFRFYDKSLMKKTEE